MAQTMSMGQAAGFSAVQSLQKNCAAKEIDVVLLRDELKNIGQKLDVPTVAADTSRNGWKNNFK
jgi:hypothetical protein